MLASLLLLLAAPSAHAAEISVLGSLARAYDQAPGEQVEGVVLVRNNDDVPREIVAELVDYRYFADGRNDFAEAGTLERSNADWVQVNPPQALVPPRSTLSVYYRITVPDDAALDGSYWSLLLVEALPVPAETDPLRATRGVEIQTVVRYGVQLISDVDGDAEGALAFHSPSVRDGAEQTILQLDVENTGARQLGPSVWADVFDEHGQRAGRVEAQGASRILPGCSARYTLDLSALTAGRYTALLIADAGGDHVFGTDLALELR